VPANEREVIAMTRLKRALGIITIVMLLIITFVAGWITGITGIGSMMDPATLPERERQFAELMQDVALVGFFTVSGREDRPARPDRYDISSVQKVGDDRWRFSARMRYGDTDVTLPVTVTMRWVDDTPMIMLTDLAIPTLGTFSARVFFYGQRYAGTWQHGTVGGHMFGSIEPATPNPR
jgi:hypothetical protein